ncbi:MAG: VOC family protein [Solirubrobacteraceae bacterium]
MELTTPDQPGAKAFYAGLFGWDADDRPEGEGHYSMQLLDGRRVAAIAGQPSQQRDAGVPPMWNSYVSVSSADESAALAAQLGGTLHAGPFDVMEAGRMAVIADPQGAFFEIWEPRENFGAELVNAPGALVWNELSTTDVQGASEFYSGLFGWSVATFENSPEAYLGIRNGAANNGGIRELKEPVPPNWLVYFGAADLDATLARVVELGGAQMVGPIDIQIARIAIVQDPEGAVFGLYAGELEP